jgi:glyoxylase-like metal-dependent hydrolase (beta-lactamase superfamily II)
MAIGDVRPVRTGDCTDLYYVGTGMYDTDGYGAVYILDAERPAIVETGIGTYHRRILDAVAELDIDREAIDVILLTHLHLNHVGGAGFLADECPNADVVTSEIGASNLTDPTNLIQGTKQAVGELWHFYTEPNPVPEDRLQTVADGDLVDLGDHTLRVWHAPGHALHQAIYYDQKNSAMFTGDAAGVWVPDLETIEETTPPWNFDLEEILADIEMLRNIDPNTLLYSHYGPRSAPGGALTEYERVLTDWVARVEEKRNEFAADESVIEYFVAETEMGEIWGEAMAQPVMAVNVRGVLDYLDARDA